MPKSKQKHAAAKPVSKVRFNLVKEISIWRKLSHFVLPLLFVFFAFGVVDGAVTSFLPIFVEGNPLLRPYGGFIVAAYSLPLVLFPGLFGHLADNGSRAKWVVLGLSLSALGLGLVGFFSVPLAALGLVFLVGTGISMFLPVIQSQVEIICEKHLNMEQKLLGETNSIWNLGFVVGAFFTGVILEITSSFAWSFMWNGVILVTALIGYCIGRSRVRMK